MPECLLTRWISMSIVKLLLLIHFTSIKWKMTWSQIIKITEQLWHQCAFHVMRFGNAEIIKPSKANSHMELHLHRNGTLIRHFFVLLRCAAPQFWLIFCFFFLFHYTNFKAVLFVSVPLLWLRHTHQDFSLQLTLIFLRLEFQNYSHVLSVSSLFDVIFCVYVLFVFASVRTNSVFTPTQWSHKSCYLWRGSNQANRQEHMNPFKVRLKVSFSLSVCVCVFFFLHKRALAISMKTSIKL